jgi:hypothetical protein
MPASTTARALRVFVGADLQDWSAHYASLEIGYDSLDEAGLIKITGTLTILNTLTVPESIDPRVNASRWRPGQPVYIQVRNDADSWLDPSFARMIVIEEPDPPGKGPLVLELGCKLAWADLLEFDDEQSGVVFGTAEACDLIASRLLQASEVGSGDISLSTWPYSIAYPFGKQGGSFAAQAGGLAWSNDGRFLHQKPDGDVTEKVLSLTPASAVQTITFGTNDLDWQPLKDPQSPAETTKVAAVGFELSTLDNPEVIVDSVTEDLNNYAPTLSGMGEVHRTTTTESFDEGDPVGPPIVAPTKTTNIQIRELEVSIFQDVSIPGQLLLYQERTRTKTYESGSSDPTKAKLVTELEVLEQREKSIVPDGIFSNMRDIYRKETTITYGADESIASIVVEEKYAEIMLDPDSANPWTLKTTRKETTTWEQVVPGRWRKVERVQTARIADDSSADKYSSNIWSLKTRTRTYRPSKNNAPPSTEFFDAGTSQAEVHYEGTASYIHRGGSTGRNRQRLFTLPFGFSDAQCAGMAAKVRDLMLGRHLGAEGRLVINDALLTAAPLPEIHVVEGATTYKYLADALSFEFTQQSSSAHCLGIWIAGGYV